jgi:hypothetical protein
MEFVHLNGEELTGKVNVKNNDRLIFGTGSTFLVVIPTEEEDHQLQ